MSSNDRPFELIFPSRKRNAGVRNIGLLESWKEGSESEYEEVYNEETDLLNIFDTYFDLTEETFRKLFSSLDHNRDGKISYQEFCQSLEALEIEITDDEMWKYIPQNRLAKGEELTFQEFSTIIQGAKMENLFKTQVVRDALSGCQPAEISSICYERSHLTSQDPVKDVKSFFTSPIPTWPEVHWIRIRNIEQLTMERLAVRYRLHPLAVEDTLTTGARPKVEQYPSHLFILVPLISVSADNDDDYVFNARSSYISAPTSMSNVKLGFSGSNSRRLSLDETPVKMLGMSRMITDQIAIFVLSKPKCPVNTVITVQHSDSQIWRKIQEKIKLKYSKIREGGVNFLLYSILDNLVDQLLPISKYYRRIISTLEDRVAKEQLKKDDINQLFGIKRELSDFLKQIRPFREVLRHIIETQNEIEYYRDVNDHLEEVLLDFQEYVESCKELHEQYNLIKANKLNEVMYVLTGVTTVFTPLQFFTGVYGMNFDFMPELRYKYSYPIFWVVAVTILTVIATIFIKIGRTFH